MSDISVTPGPADPRRKPEEEAKLPYHSPVLTVYGSIAAITANVGPYGRRDNSRGGRRTGFDQGNGNYNG